MLLVAMVVSRRVCLVSSMGELALVLMKNLIVCMLRPFLQLSASFDMSI